MCSVSMQFELRAALHSSRCTIRIHRDMALSHGPDFELEYVSEAKYISRGSEAYQ
jgi:hypothetical protein